MSAHLCYTGRRVPFWRCRNTNGKEMDLPRLRALRAFSSLSSVAYLPTDVGPSSAYVVCRTRSAACASCDPSDTAPRRDTDKLGGIDSSMCTWSRLTDPACTTISCARAVSRNNSRHRNPTSPPSTGYRYFVTQTRWYLQSQTVWPPRLYASIQPINTGSAAIPSA